MHLISPEQSGRRVIDGERVCQAIEALDHGADIQARAKTFALLGDPTRLTLLTCIKAAGPISVSDLAAATGLNREQAEELLTQSGGEVKTAILLGKTDLTPEQARAQLAAHGNVLRATLDEVL